jgi:glyceraldehyde-3-phosphate dehydrogenase type I
MKAKVGINGFGRIGRLFFRIGYKSDKFEIAAINDITDAKTLAHLLKYDSVHRTFGADVQAKGNALMVGGKEYRVFAEKDPSKLPWKELGVDYVLESTGLFRDYSKAELHIKGGAKRVVLSAPGKGEPKIPGFVMGVNHKNYDPKQHMVISNASCTTNCFAPIVKVLHENFKIRKGLMTTTHSYTNDQKILDLPHKDLRRARAAALSMIPTSTGAAKAIVEIFPDLKGKLDAIALRVPTPDVSVVDFVAELEKETTREEINSTFKKAGEGDLKGILLYSEEPLVSSDFIGCPYSAVFDAELTKVINNVVKVFGWYDNEYGYSARTVELFEYIIGRE